ncbi:putative reverse transcriptase domain-containing protein [Tanacetum coccineum]
MSMTIQSSVKDKILATSSETSKVENAPAEMLRDLDQQMEKRADDGKANVVTDALSRKERVKPRRVRAMAMTIQYGVRGMILTAQSEAFKQENVPLVGSEMDEAHASRYLVHPGADKKYYNLGDILRYLSENEIEPSWILSLNFQGQSTDGQSERKSQTLEDIMRACVIDFGSSYHLSIWCAPFEALYGRKCRSPVLWVEIGESSLTGLELVQETSDKKGVMRFGKKDASLHVPLDEIKVDKTLCFVEEPVENSDREVKRFLTSLLDEGRGSSSWMFLFVWSGYAAMRTLCGQAKLLAVRYLLNLGTRFPKGGDTVTTMTWAVSVTVSLLWIVDSERDHLIVVRFVSMFVIIERERLNVD